LSLLEVAVQAEVPWIMNSMASASTMEVLPVFPMD